MTDNESNMNNRIKQWQRLRILLAVLGVIPLYLFFQLKKVFQLIHTYDI